MSLVRVAKVVALDGFRLRLDLTDGTVVERDVRHLLNGPVFEDIRRRPAAFRAVRVEGGTVAWVNGADLDPDVLIWGGPPPIAAERPPAVVEYPARDRR